MNLLRKLAVVVVALAGMSAAQADLITYEYSGTILSAISLNSDGALNFLGLERGDTVTGSFTYDSTAQDTDLDPVSIFLPNSLTAFRFAGLEAGIIDYSYFQAPTGISGPIQSYVNDVNTGYSDVYSFLETVSRFEFLRTFFSEGGPNGPRRDKYNVALESLSITSVPEPSTLALLGIGLFGMGLFRRRKAV